MIDEPIGQEGHLDTDAPPDRRRLGRLNDVSPELIPLLRGSSRDSLPDLADDENPHDLAAARGILFAAFVSIILWALIALAVWVVI